MDRSDGGLNRLPRSVVVALAAPPTLVIGLFVVVPVVVLAARTVDLGALGSLGSRRVASVAWFTLWQAALTTVASLVVGAVPAWLVARCRFRGMAAMRAVLVIPFMLPTVVTGAAFLSLLPTTARGTWWAIVLAHAYVNVAVVVRVVGTAWETIPHDLTAAARTLGASPSRVATTVVVPILAPAIAAAGAVVFAFAATSFGIVRILGDTGTTTIEAEVARRALQYGDVGGAVVLSVAQLVVLAAVAALATRTRRRRTAVLRGDALPRPPRRGAPHVRAVLTAALTTGLVALPLVALSLMSFRVGDHWTLRPWTTWGNGEIRPGISLGVDPWGSIRASLVTALVATLLAVAVGTLAAFAIAEMRASGRWLEAGAMLPLAISGVTVGLGMLVTFARPPVDWRGDWWLVPLGHSLIGLPFVTRLVLGRLATIDPDQRHAALLLGASPRRAWWEVVARRIVPVVGPAAALSAAVSLGEFGATTLLSRSGTTTLPLAIEGLLTRPGDLPRARGFALATVLMLVTGLLVSLAERSTRARRP